MTARCSTSAMLRSLVTGCEFVADRILDPRYHERCSRGVPWNDGDAALRFVQDVRDFLQVEDAPLPQLRAEVIVGESAPSQFGWAGFPVGDEHADAVINELAQHRLEP